MSELDEWRRMSELTKKLVRDNFHIEAGGFNKTQLQKDITDFVAEEVKAGQREILRSTLKHQLPWPTDVFGEVGKNDWPKIDEFATKELGYRIDRISGTLMRQGWRCLERKIKEDLAELEEDK